MTASATLLPGTLVLFDTDDHWAQKPLRGRRGVIVHRYEPGIGQAVDADLVVCIGPCGAPEHNLDCPSAVAFKADELHPVPDPTQSATATGEGQYGIGLVIT